MTTSDSQPAGRILVVEDERDIAALVAYQLTKAGYDVRTVSDGAAALKTIAADPPDLVVLDLMLPGIPGLGVLREIRGSPATENIPVILLTALRDEQNRIEGLQLGADDYVPKPFSPQELTLRVTAVLRRAHQEPLAPGGSKLLRAGPVRIDVDAATAEVQGKRLDLSPTEYRLLTLLVERRGRVQSRRQLLELVWDTKADLKTRTVDMHIQRLRAKLGPAAPWLETVRGFGYRFRTELSER